MQDRVMNREKKKQEIMAQAAGDLDAEGERNLKKALVINSITSTKFANVSRRYSHVGVGGGWRACVVLSCVQEKIISKTKLDIFENAFRKIKEATGVSDVNEVIQKVVNQEGTTENLMMLTKENQVSS
eukprot:51642-Eustigmatos_ZCMA.PRE.1